MKSSYSGRKDDFLAGLSGSTPQPQETKQMQLFLFPEFDILYILFLPTSPPKAEKFRLSIFAFNSFLTLIEVGYSFGEAKASLSRARAVPSSHLPQALLV
jgi:hypothetical protein